MSTPALAQIPGLKVVCPVDAYDCKALLIQSIRDNDPTVFLEHKNRYAGTRDAPKETCDRAKPCGRWWLGADMSAKQEPTGMSARAAALYKADDEAMAVFHGLIQAANREGKLRRAMKETIATAVGIGRGCEDCIVYRTSEARAHGASREGFPEVLATANEMSGGPGTVCGARALAAFDES